MADVAMDEPLARVQGLPNHIISLARADVDRISQKSRLRRQGLAVASHDLKRAAMDVDRMDEAIVGSHQAHLQRLADLHTNGVGSWKSLTVKREVVRLAAIHGHRRIGQAFAFQPFLHHQRIFVIRGETGIHGWTRNPIYLGMFLIYGGIGLAAQSPWVLMITLPLAITIRYGVVAREEAYLERRFGDVYRDYKARVRRWL